MNISTIEGNSFSGKTTLVECVKQFHDVTMVAEYDEYVGGGANFPAFPPDSISDACKAIDFFVEVERRRSSDAIELAERYGKPVIMDRSPFSCILFQSVVKDNNVSVPNAFLYSIERFIEKSISGEIVLPTSLIYLYPTLTQFKSRRDSRGRVGIDFLNLETTLLYSNDWYRMLCSMLKKGNALEIQSSEGNVQLDAYLVTEFLSRVDISYNSISLLEDLYRQHEKKRS